jgi:hypothetical protein
VTYLTLFGASSGKNCAGSFLSLRQARCLSITLFGPTFALSLGVGLLRFLCCKEIRHEQSVALVNDRFIVQKCQKPALDNIPRPFRIKRPNRIDRVVAAGIQRAGPVEFAHEHA